MDGAGFNIDAAIVAALEKISRSLQEFGSLFPHDITQHNCQVLHWNQDDFPDGSNLGWTTGFWTGMLWLAYELSGEERFRNTAGIQVMDFKRRIEQKVDCDHHDLGFLYSLSCVAAYRLTGWQEARQAALLAADALITRYLPAPGIIQAWGSLDDPGEQGRAIIDSLMNLPLLYWASGASGDSTYAQIARRHARQLRQTLLRPDASTYHTYFFDPVSGAPRFGRTYQGLTDDSCWARGQAWALYGFTLSYSYTRELEFLEAAQQIADYFLTRTPQNGVVYWDFTFEEGSAEEKDSSASAIAACGLLELSRQLPDDLEYQAAGERILSLLARDYSSFDLPESNALLLHGVENKPAGTGVDEASLWGDYFFLEGLMRLKQPDWKMYW